MPRVTRSRLIATEPDSVWNLVADPHNLPRWWPRALRVEDVREGGDQAASWTMVLGTDRGSGVRADYRRTDLAEGELIAWEQEVAGTPFERILRSSELEIRLADEAGGTVVSMTLSEGLRGLSRLGSPMVRGAARRRVDEALEGMERALVGTDD